MNNFWSFLTNSPFTSFFIALIICITIESVVHKILETIQIRKHGYPCNCAKVDKDIEPCEDCPRRKK